MQHLRRWLVDLAILCSACCTSAAAELALIKIFYATLLPALLQSDMLSLCVAQAALQEPKGNLTAFSTPAS